MEARAKLFGHPIHQMLIVFPLGLLATAVIFDVVQLVSGNGYWSEIAYWMIAAGIMMRAMAPIVSAIPNITKAITPNSRIAAMKTTILNSHSRQPVRNVVSPFLVMTIMFASPGIDQADPLFRWPNVRSRNALSLMKPAASFWS